ncbi:MAG: hypothetical protein PHE55_00875 [Methylococcaceae bacterium]|nr:hypothetical protein [Methylococcaceae bacterium]
MSKSTTKDIIQALRQAAWARVELYPNRGRIEIGSDTLPRHAGMLHLLSRHKAPLLDFLNGFQTRDHLHRARPTAAADRLAAFVIERMKLDRRGRLPLFDVNQGFIEFVDYPNENYPNETPRAFMKRFDAVVRGLALPVEVIGDVVHGLRWRTA